MWLNNNMKQNNNARERQHWLNNMKRNINARETTNWKNTNNHRTREEQYQYRVMEWLKKNFKPKPKEKRINYKKQEPQFNFLNAKLFIANSMEKKWRWWANSNKALYIWDANNYYQKKSKTLIQQPHSTPAPSSSSSNPLSNFTTLKVNSWGRDPS